MNCTHCNKPLKIPNRVYYNCDTYDETCVSVTNCCGKMVVVRPVRTYNISKYTGDRTEDDWGVPVESIA